MSDPVHLALKRLEAASQLWYSLGAKHGCYDWKMNDLWRSSISRYYTMLRSPPTVGRSVICRIVWPNFELRAFYSRVGRFLRHYLPFEPSQSNILIMLEDPAGYWTHRPHGLDIIKYIAYLKNSNTYFDQHTKCYAPTIIIIINMSPYPGS